MPALGGLRQHNLQQHRQSVSELSWLGSTATNRNARAYLVFAIMLMKLTGIGISGLVVEYIVAIDVTRVRFPADALSPRAL